MIGSIGVFLCYFILTHLIGDYVLAVIGLYSYLVSTLVFYLTLALRLKAHYLQCILPFTYLARFTLIHV